MGRRVIRRVSRRFKLQMAAGLVMGTSMYFNWQWATFDVNEAHPWITGEGGLALMRTGGGGGAKKTSGYAPGKVSGAGATDLDRAPVMAPGELLGGHPATYYNETGQPKENCKLRPPLVRNGRDDPSAPIYDVCVVGGGVAGLQTALYLAEKHKKKVILLEGKRLGMGASGRNGGEAIVGFSAETDELESILGDRKAAELLYHQSVVAYDRLKDTIKKYKIQCEAKEVGAVTLSFAQQHHSDSKMKRLLGITKEECDEHWEKYGERLEVWSKAELDRRGIRTDRFSHGVFNPLNITLNPLELTLGLARACEENKVVVHEASPVQSVRAVSSWKANVDDTNQHFQLISTPLGSVKAKHVVLATSHCSTSFSRSVAYATVPVSTGIMVTKELPKKELDEVFSSPVAVFDERYSLNYFRRVPGNRILFGGCAEALPMKRNYLVQKLTSELCTTFPTLEPYVEADRVWQGRIDTRWPVFPLLGKLSGEVKTSSVWYNMGYAGHGLVPSVAGATALGEYLVTEGEDDQLAYWTHVNLKLPLLKAPRSGPQSPALWPIGGPWGTTLSSLVVGLIHYRESLLTQHQGTETGSTLERTTESVTAMGRQFMGFAPNKPNQPPGGESPSE